MVDSQGGTTTLSYDGGQLATEGYENGAMQLLLSLGYDDSGNLTSAERYADLAGTTLVGSSEYDYDAGNMTSIVYKNGSGGVLTSFGYTYDEAEQLISEVDDGATTTYGYDSSGQLTQAGSTSYSYDGNGNPIGAGVTIGPDNEVQTDGTWNYGYDGAGNLTSLTGVSNGLTWSYGYDAANELTSVTETDGGGRRAGAGELQLRCVRQPHRHDGDAGRDDDHDVLDVRGGVVAAGGRGTDELAAVRRHEQRQRGGGCATSAGSQPDQWFAQVVTGSGVQWDLTDHLGSIRVVVDAGGSTMLDEISYDAFGVETETNPGAGGRLGYAGYQYDASNGAGSGWRAASTTHRFRFGCSRTPAQVGSNFYVYADNRPTSLTDPSGLSPETIDKQNRIALIQENQAKIDASLAARRRNWFQQKALGAAEYGPAPSKEVDLLTT